MRNRSCTILLVEDEESDVVHFQRLLRKHGIDGNLVVARDGEMALEILRRRDGRPQPHIIFTDLNMPGLTGHELIDEIRADPALCRSIIFVLSTSDLADDIDRAYEKNIAGYIVKDPHGERIESAIAMLEHYVRAVSVPEPVVA